MSKISNRSLSLLTAMALVALAPGSALRAQSPRQTPSKQNLEVDRSIEIYRNVLNGVSLLYVDTMNVQKMTEVGINAALSQLDPYTIYMPEAESEDFLFMTTGEYGGIGAYIQQLDSAVYVQSPMPGTPAAKGGLKMGDRFLAIDGESVVPSTSEKVSRKLKGPIGTDVRVRIRRLGESKDREIVLTRENVQVDQVVHRGIYQDSIGYIRLNSFTNKSGDDVRRAYEELRKSGKMKSLILDLRGNGGGVLDDAVKILGLFVPQNTMVLHTQGKLPQTSQKYYTETPPLSLDLPIVTLINGASASAAEILSGTLQDLDRSVLVGTRSFGKGLVQSTRPLPYNGVLKVTIARYYIPSGRCIQQLDYSHRNPDGTVAAVPDSLTRVFHTVGGREVRDGGGIRPDVEVKDEVMSPLVYSLVRDGYLFDYSNQLFLSKPAPKTLADVTVTDVEYDAFIAQLESKKFEYGKNSLKLLDNLRELAEYEGYKERSEQTLEQLKKQLTPSLREDAAKNKEQVKSLLRGLLAQHYFGMEGQYAVNLECDPTFEEALKILGDPARYRAILAPPSTKK